MSFLRALLAAAASGAAAGGLRPPPKTISATPRVQDDRDSILINAAAQHAARGGDPDGLAEFQALSPADQLRAIEKEIEALPAKERTEVTRLLSRWLGMKFIPMPGPQSDAYYSKADILLYGGAAGGGKSGLILGLALQEHQRSLIFRPQYNELGALTEDLLKFYGKRDGFREKPYPRLKTDDGRLIDFGAAQRPGDEGVFQGQPHDLLAFDEAANFQESQIRFLMTWLRTEVKGQRCRVVLATNPPTSAEGQWLIDMFAPWLQKGHPDYLAKPGDLRWYVSDEDGNDKQVPGPDPVMIGGKPVMPMSRTFIPARLGDNVYLADTNYARTLDGLQGPIRAIMRDGDWDAFRKDDMWQVIPTAWVRAAMQRWAPMPPAGQRMTCIGVDVAQGGDDATVLAPRYGSWFSHLVVEKGKETPDGYAISSLVTRHIRDKATVAIDMGGGWGGHAAAHMKQLGFTIAGFNGAEASRTQPKGGKGEYQNRRAEAYAAFRDALDPSSEHAIALPPDPQLEVELCMPRWDQVALGRRGVWKVEAKDELRSRLGRSPDRADAVVMSWFMGPTLEQERAAQRPRQTQAKTGYEHMKQRYGSHGAKRQTSYKAQGRR
jgi:hypothetical protein